MTVDTENAEPKSRYLVLHILCWAVLIITPMFFHSSGDDWLVVLNRYMRWLGNPLAYLLVFYLNYLWLVPRFLLKKNDWKMFLFINLLALICGVFMVDVWHCCAVHLLPSLNDNPPKRPTFKFQRYFWAVLTLILIISLAVAVRMIQRWQHIEEARKEAETARAEAELSNLRNQLNPHFLLNTLNNIYALIAFDSSKAQTAVEELSRLLRHALYDNQQQFVPLYKEVEFMHNYIELMKIRYTSGVNITTDIRIENDDATPVAPLMFISLLENAFKHGISPEGKGSIRVTMLQQNGEVTCDIVNTNHPKRDNDKSGSGIGLEQVAKRLELLYPGRYQWHRGVNEQDNTYHSTLTINTNNHDND